MGQSSKIHVCNLVNSFLSRQGNIGIRTGHVVDALNEAKIINSVVSRGNFSISFNPYTTYYNNSIFGNFQRLLNGMRIYLYPQFNHRPLDVHIYEYYASKQLVKISRSINEPQKILHLWETSPKLLKIAKSLGFKVLLDVPIAPTKFALTTIPKDSAILSKQNERAYQTLINWETQLYHEVDKIISPSQFIASLIEDEIGQSSKSKITVIPFGANLSKVVRTKFKSPTDVGIDFVFAGSLNFRKGMHHLLTVFSKEEFKNDRLHLCGRLFSDTKKMLQKLNLRNVITPGFVNTSEYFKKCDVLVHPSLLEGSAKSIYEGMASGLACLVTDRSGSIISHGEDGIIFKADSEKELYSALIHIKRHPEMIQSLGERAQQSVAQYSWINYGKRVLNTYLTVL